MRYSIFHALGDPGRLDRYHTAMDEAREFAVAAEQAGFWSVWYTEHHFGHEGQELTPNPVLMGVDIAARTNRIRIGQAAAIATFWHPLRLAEDLAMLDQLSGGRLEVGLGRGLYGREALNLNRLADPRDQEQNRALFDETVEILLKAWGTTSSTTTAGSTSSPPPASPGTTRCRRRHRTSPPTGWSPRCR
jgi:alkanesulfonate monooxygenase SsuD/methylene tetrahydromethanopterin reductase-like flavin-dependent oxidoreductase (luciferase family)